MTGQAKVPNETEEVFTPFRLYPIVVIPATVLMPGVNKRSKTKKNWHRRRDR